MTATASSIFSDLSPFRRGCPRVHGRNFRIAQSSVYGSKRFTSRLLTMLTRISSVPAICVVGRNTFLRYIRRVPRRTREGSQVPFPVGPSLVAECQTVPKDLKSHYVQALPSTPHESLGVLDYSICLHSNSPRRATGVGGFDPRDFYNASGLSEQLGKTRSCKSRRKATRLLAPFYTVDVLSTERVYHLQPA